MKNINWGIIGCGNVTELKSGPAFNQIEGSKLVAVMRRDAKLAEDYAKRHNVKKWYSNGDELINDPEVNAVYVATPPSSHAEWAIKAMLAGKPVYVEKPMATSVAECIKMNEISQQTGVPIFVAYYRRSLPGFIKVKELLDNQTIGKPLQANIRLLKAAEKEIFNPDNLPWRVNPEIAGGGLFFDLASHQLDYLQFILGDFSQTSGFATNNAKLYSAEDTVVAQFTFSNGVVGTGNWCFVTDPSSEEDRMEIIGTKGRIIFSCFNADPIRLITQQGEVMFPYTNPSSIQYGMIKQIVEYLQDNSKPIISSGETAIKTSKALEIITQNYYPKKV